MESIQYTCRLNYDDIPMDLNLIFLNCNATKSQIEFLIKEFYLLIFDVKQKASLKNEPFELFIRCYGRILENVEN